jgi:putative ABC transport system permease protein
MVYPWRNLSRRPARTLLTLSGIAIGIAAIVVLTTAADGLSRYYSVFGGGGAHLLITQEESVDAVFSAVDEDVGQELSRIREVGSVAGMLVTLTSLERVPYFIVYGYDPQGFAIEHFRVTEGEGLSAGAKGTRGKPLILGRMAAQHLEKGIGDSLKLPGGIYRVVGIYETGRPTEESGAVIPLNDAQEMAGSVSSDVSPTYWSPPHLILPVNRRH